MALFAFWHESAAGGRPAALLRNLLAAQAHIVPEATVAADLPTADGRWHLSAFSTKTRFYAARAQVWTNGREACAIHGLVWRVQEGRPRLLDAEAVAALLPRPGDTLPADVAGEFAVARLHACGTLTAFSDAAGLHQLFHATEGRPVVASRASLVATILDDWSAEPDALAWLPTVGYRIGEATAFRAVRQLGQGRVATVRARSIEDRPAPAPIVAFPERRGIDGAAIDEGIAQATAAILLAAGDGPIDLPITGGKDSRVILALCLAAGLHDRLTLFTRGYEGHPDVVAGRGVAATMGLPHRREAPHGSDEAAAWPRPLFFEKMAVQAWQTDGMVGGWDLILGQRVGTETLITGHLGEVLKAYAKRPMPDIPPDGILDPAEMVQLQGPFDPMGLLRPEARARLAGEIAGQMRAALDAGAAPGDLPDLFYLQNRIPNWLGAVRAIKSFERQPVAPLGVPALLRLAFRMSPEDRKSDALHHRIVAATAPALLAPPFALQRWDARLGPDVPRPEPIAAPPGLPVFGNWQYSVNDPAIRSALAGLVRARPDLSLWRAIDPQVVLQRLTRAEFGHFEAISLLGLVAALLQESAALLPRKVGGQDTREGRPTDPAALSVLLAPEPGTARHP